MRFFQKHIHIFFSEEFIIGYKWNMKKLKTLLLIFQLVSDFIDHIFQSFTYCHLGYCHYAFPCQDVLLSKKIEI